MDNLGPFFSSDRLASFLQTAKLVIAPKSRPPQKLGKKKVSQYLLWELERELIVQVNLLDFWVMTDD